MAKTAAAELAPRKIRVNKVSPVPTRTNVLNAFYRKEMADSIWEELAGKVLLKQVGSPVDVAKMVVFLCGEEAFNITGSDFVMDGGMTL